MIPADARAMIIESLAAGCALSLACKGAGVAEADCRASMSDPSEEGRAFAAAVSRAADEGARAIVQASRPAPPKPSPDLAKAPTVRSAAQVMPEGSTDFDAFRKEAERKYGPGRMALYLLQDDRLVARGMPPTSPWWKWSIGGFLDSGLTWFVPMVGRGAGKSTNLEKLLLVVVLLTRRFVPPGQPWTCPFMSVVERDAIRRIVEIKSLLLLAYGIEVKVSGYSIKVKDCCGNEIEIVSTAGTIGQVSGPTTVGAFFDEAAKMHTGAGAANLDSEIIASIVGTSRELEGWVGVRCSSAFGTQGAHFANVMEGTNSENYVPTIGIDFIDDALAGYEDGARWESAQGNTHGAAQIRAFAKTLHPGSPNVATWVARPTLSALKSRLKLETLPKDDPSLEGLSRFDYWIREYGSMPLSRDGTPDYTDQCMMAGAMTRRLTDALAGRTSPRQDGQPMKVAGARMGDVRYAGPMPRGAMPSTNWKTRRSI